MSKNITVKKAKRALQNLRQLTPANPKVTDDLEMTVKESVFFMAPDLIKMSKRGFTVKELADGLAGAGVEVKPSTLNRYLNEYAEKNPEHPQPGTGPAGTGKEEATPAPGPGTGKDEATPAIGPGTGKEDATPAIGPGTGKEEADPAIGPGTGKEVPGPRTGAAGTGEEKTDLENPTPPLKNPKPGGQTADEKSDSPPEDQSPPSSFIDRE